MDSAVINTVSCGSVQLLSVSFPQSLTLSISLHVTTLPETHPHQTRASPTVPTLASLHSREPNHSLLSVSYPVHELLSSQQKGAENESNVWQGSHMLSELHYPLGKEKENLNIQPPES